MSCYHIDDEYSFADVEQPTDEGEARLIRRVDQVFVTSLGLLDKKGHLNPHTLFVPNGVDYAAYVRPWPEPADLRPIPHPRVGYVGVIKKQLDLRLVYALAQRHRAWSFVLVGPQRHHEEIEPLVDQLRMLSNVHFLGEKPVSALPSYTQHMDVLHPLLQGRRLHEVSSIRWKLPRSPWPAACPASAPRFARCRNSRPCSIWQHGRGVVGRAGDGRSAPPRARRADRDARREVAAPSRLGPARATRSPPTPLADRLGPSYRERVQEAGAGGACCPATRDRRAGQPSPARVAGATGPTW
jgi:glycosyltransferase involved in cell wall biosynthesis